MTTYAFQIGLTLRRGTQILEFTRMVSPIEVQFEDVITRRAYTWPIAKIQNDILKNELAVVKAEPVNKNSLEPEPGFVRSLESLPDAQRNQVKYRINIIKFLRKLGISRGKRKEIESALKKRKLQSDALERLPSASAVMEWMRKWELSGHNPTSLISRHFYKERPKNFSYTVEDWISKILRSNYFCQNRPPLSEAHALINTKLEQLKTTGQISNDEASMSLTTLRRRVQEVDPYLRDTYRYGAAYARNKWRYSLGGAGASRALQRLEVDHTLLDIVVISDTNGMPLGRPVITIIVDAYSKYLVGFYISFAGPGLSPVLNTMKVGILSKETFTAHTNVLTNPWLGYGIGEMYVVDNGLEFHSKQFVLAAMELNTDLQYCPVRQPWLKPSVERYFLDLGYALPRSGKVLKPVANMLPIDPALTARISFSELSLGLLKYFVDVHPFKVNSRTLCRPFDLFKESFETLPPPMLPTNFESLGLIAAHSKSLTVGNEGVVMNGLRFNSKDLQSVRRTVANTYKTLVKFDPEDLGYAYVQHPKSLDWLFVENVNPSYSNGLSMSQHRAIRTHRRKANIKGEYEQSYLKARTELIEIWNNLSGSKRLKKSAKDALLLQGLSSTKSLQITQNDPINVPNSRLVASNEIESLNNTIPTFETYIND